LEKKVVLLELRELSKNFGGLRALDKVSTGIQKGEIVGLIGPNGAGKTTLFNVVSGFYKPSEGTVLFKEEDVTHLKPFQISSRGLTRTYQETNLFHDFSVEENILIGCHLRPNIGFFEQVFGMSSARGKQGITTKKIGGILELLELTSLKNELAKNLSHGYQRTLGVAIALATEPELLMLDEPFSGMNVEETKSMMAHIQKIHQEKNLTILLVEHDMKAVMELCDRLVVLNFGKKIAEGSPNDIQKDRAVIEAYLGADENVV
jgi:branched-chain amino acid transport system ATP-binding protein